MIMSKDKAFPKGLEKEEVGRGKIKRPLVPYIPLADPIGDAVKDSAGTKSFKVSLPDGTIVYHAVFDNRLNEAFVIHVQEIMNFCKSKGFYDGYNVALAQLKETVSRKSTSTKKLESEKDDPTSTKENQKAHERSNVLAKFAVTNAKKELLKHGLNFSPSTRRC